MANILISNMCQNAPDQIRQRETVTREKGHLPMLSVRKENFSDKQSDEDDIDT